MNRNRMLVFAFFAVALSVAVAYLAYRVLQSRLTVSSDNAQIVVAVDKLSVGTRLTEQQLRLAPWPSNIPMQGSFIDPKELVGRGVIIPMSPNEPVLESKLAPKEAGAGLTSVIPDGMRAVSVSVNAVIGVAGFVLPGSHVDVIAVGSPDSQGNNEVSKVFLENVEVLAAGQNVERDNTGKPQNVQVVTLLVRPEDAQKLALASVDSRVQLALRNPIDLVEANPIAVNKSAIYGSSSSPGAAPKPTVIRPIVRRAAPKPVNPAPVAAPAPTHVTVEVELIKGDKREKTTFEKKLP
ncbi:MAG TPA: Flp pilus assembly protein CpaB [Blastocatellia bacterium]|nr:Flp pilus assembly protein CpaB [Blastocatellia bacterium]